MLQESGYSQSYRLLVSASDDNHYSKVQLIGPPSESTVWSMSKKSYLLSLTVHV